MSIVSQENKKYGQNESTETQTLKVDSFWNNTDWKIFEYIRLFCLLCFRKSLFSSLWRMILMLNLKVLY